MIDVIPGQCDQIWRLNNQQVLVAGWLVDRSPSASVQLEIGGQWLRFPITAPRLWRPDVASALGIQPDEACDYGFLKLLRLSIQSTLPKTIRVGSTDFAWKECDRRGDDLCSLGRDLVDLCHWNFTPGFVLKALLASDLGCVLREKLHAEHKYWWHQMSQGRLRAEIMASGCSPEMRIVLEISNDPAEQQLQVLRVASGLKEFLAGNASKRIHLLVVEHQCFALEHQAVVSQAPIQELCWMIPASTSVLKVPSGCGSDGLKAVLNAAPSADQTIWITRDQLLSGHGLSTMPLPQHTPSQILATATSWRRAVDTWMQGQSWGGIE